MPLDFMGFKLFILLLDRSVGRSVRRETLQYSHDVFNNAETTYLYIVIYIIIIILYYSMS